MPCVSACNATASSRRFVELRECHRWRNRNTASSSPQTFHYNSCPERYHKLPEQIRPLPYHSRHRITRHDSFDTIADVLARDAVGHSHVDHGSSLGARARNRLVRATLSAP